MHHRSRLTQNYTPLIPNTALGELCAQAALISRRRRFVHKNVYLKVAPMKALMKLTRPHNQHTIYRASSGRRKSFSFLDYGKRGPHHLPCHNYNLLPSNSTTLLISILLFALRYAGTAGHHIPICVQAMGTRSVLYIHYLYHAIVDGPAEGSKVCEGPLGSAVFPSNCDLQLA